MHTCLGCSHHVSLLAYYCLGYVVSFYGKPGCQQETEHLNQPRHGSNADLTLLGDPTKAKLKSAEGKIMEHVNVTIFRKRTEVKRLWQTERNLKLHAHNHSGRVLEFSKLSCHLSAFSRLHTRWNWLHVALNTAAPNKWFIWIGCNQRILLNSVPSAHLSTPGVLSKTQKYSGMLLWRVASKLRLLQETCQNQPAFASTLRVCSCQNKLRAAKGATSHMTRNSACFETAAASKILLILHQAPANLILPMALQQHPWVGRLQRKFDSSSGYNVRANGRCSAEGKSSLIKLRLFLKHAAAAL